jgi:hypothetical protein
MCMEMNNKYIVPNFTILSERHYSYFSVRNDFAWCRRKETKS